jgi:hypothetical protein
MLSVLAVMVSIWLNPEGMPKASKTARLFWNQILRLNETGLRKALTCGGHIIGGPYIQNFWGPHVLSVILAGTCGNLKEPLGELFGLELSGTLGNFGEPRMKTFGNFIMFGEP